jgi:hypothetical protein
MGRTSKWQKSIACINLNFAVDVLYKKRKNTVMSVLNFPKKAKLSKIADDAASKLSVANQKITKGIIWITNKHKYVFHLGDIGPVKHATHIALFFIIVLNLWTLHGLIHSFSDDHF